MQEIIDIQLNKKEKKRNKKAGVQVFMILLVFLTLSMLIMIFYIISDKRSAIQGFPGEKSMELIKTYQEGEKIMQYIQEKADFTYAQSVYELAEQGGFSEQQKCGKYRGRASYYNNPEFCLPLEPQKQILPILNKNMNYLEKEPTGEETTAVYTNAVQENGNIIYGNANGSIGYHYWDLGAFENRVIKLHLASATIEQFSSSQYNQYYNLQGNGQKTFPVCNQKEDLLLDLSSSADKKVKYGKLWIPAQALCGGEFPLLIMLHGHDKIQHQYYLGDKAVSRIDPVVKGLVLEQKIYPVLLAAPQGVPEVNNNDPWPASEFSVVDYITAIKQEAQKKGITLSKVSIIGHSAANCYANGGLQGNTNKFEFYLIGSADGTCGPSEGISEQNNYAKHIFDKIKSKNTIYVLMHRNTDSGDKASEKFMTDNSVDDSQNMKLQGKYDSVVRKQELQNGQNQNVQKGENYRYLLDSQKYNHMSVPPIMVQEILLRFFTVEKFGVAAPNLVNAQDIQLNGIGCTITRYNIDSQSIGSASCGALQNGIKIGSGNPYYRILRDPEKHYGTSELINTIEKIGCVITHEYGNTGKVAVGHMSQEGGGKLSVGSGHFHASHQSGRDADIGFYFRNKQGVLTTEMTTMADAPTQTVDSRFDAKANWLFIREFIKQDSAEAVFIYQPLEDAIINYAVQTNEDPALIKKAKDMMQGGFTALGIQHNNHFHIRIKCPSGDSLCNKKRITAAECTSVADGE